MTHISLSVLAGGGKMNRDSAGESDWVLWGLG